MGKLTFIKSMIKLINFLSNVAALEGNVLHHAPITVTK